MPLCTVLDGCVVSASCVAAPATPVAVKDTGLPASASAVAVSVFGPAAVPKVHAVTAAMPLALVVTAVVGVTVPPPPVTAKVTATPATGLPLPSLTITDGGMTTAVPTVAVWLFPALRAIWVAAPAIPVAVNATGLPARPAAVAVRVFVPAVVAKVHDVTAAIPLAFVGTAVVGLTVPPPDATVNVTATPATGHPNEFVTRTDGAMATALPALAVWLFPPLMAIWVAAPAVLVAAKFTGLPVSPGAVAVRVFVPHVVPSVQEVTAAMPPALVSTALVGVTVPPPTVTAKVTATPATGLPLASFTITDGGMSTAVPTVAVWVLPAFTATWVAVPAVTVTAPDVTAVSPGEVKLSVRAPTKPVMARLVNTAAPPAVVVTVAVPPSVPPPVAMAAVTDVPLWLTGFPAASCS